MRWENVIALLGVVISLFLGVYNLYVNTGIKKRIHFVDTITAERIKWLEKLRCDISRFSGLTSFWVKSLKGANDEYSRNILKEIDILRVMIKLRLNPKGEPDKEIIILIDKIPALTDQINITDLNHSLDKLTEASQELLK